MLHELTIYKGKGGQGGALAELFRSAIFPLRRSIASGFKGAWLSEFGALNSLYVIWEFEDVSTQQHAAVALAENSAWQSHSVALGELLEGLEVTLLRPLCPVTRRHDEGAVYDFRFYDLKPFQAEAYARTLIAGLPTREKYSPNFGIWAPLTGDMQRVIHLWPYDSLEHRIEVRAKTATEPNWAKHVGKAIPLLVQQTSSLVRPLPGLAED